MSSDEEILSQRDEIVKRLKTNDGYGIGISAFLAAEILVKAEKIESILDENKEIKLDRRKSSAGHFDDISMREFANEHPETCTAKTCPYSSNG